MPLKMDCQNPLNICTFLLSQKNQSDLPRKSLILKYFGNQGLNSFTMD